MMNLWQCDDPGCKTRATGSGSAIGLRAIGWYVKIGHDFTLYCPIHHPEYSELSMRINQCLLAESKKESRLLFESTSKTMLKESE